jgi:hypothetical protein
MMKFFVVIPLWAGCLFLVSPPSIAVACQATPMLHEITLLDDGDGFPACVGLETLGGYSASDQEVQLKIDNGCDETFHLETTDLPWLDSVTVEPGETGSWGGDESFYYEVFPISISWTLGEGEANSAQMDMESYYPDWDTCPGCNHHRGSSPLPPLALMLLGSIGFMALFKRRFSL